MNNENVVRDAGHRTSATLICNETRQKLPKSFRQGECIMRYASIENFLGYLTERKPGQPEFIQAVTEVMESLWPYVQQHPRYAEQGLLDRMIEPERVLIFRLS